MNERSCGRCAYVGRVRGSEPEELICVNCPLAPGELVRVQFHGACSNFRAKRKLSLRLPRTPASALPPPPSDKICYIALTKGRYAMVDAVDYPELSQYKWFAMFNGRKFYAARHKNGKPVYMHREIMQPPPGMVTDHIDGNSENNCRSNLRNCTPRENQWNSRGRGNISGFKGVYYKRKSGRYETRVSINARQVYLGCFKDPVEAARVRDRKALAVYGQYAFINLPQDLEPRPVPPDPNQPERPTTITGPYGYLRCPPYLPRMPEGSCPTGIGIRGISQIIRIVAWAMAHADAASLQGQRRQPKPNGETGGQTEKRLDTGESCQVPSMVKSAGTP